MSDNRTEDPASIEQDVRHTQDEIGSTLEKLEDQLTPRSVARSVMGDRGTESAREVLDLIKQNPVPVGLIAIGAIWLLATSRSPLIKRLTGSMTGRSDTSSLRPRAAEPAPIGPPPETGPSYDRRGAPA